MPTRVAPAQSDGGERLALNGLAHCTKPVHRVDQRTLIGVDRARLERCRAGLSNRPVTRLPRRREPRAASRIKTARKLAAIPGELGRVPGRAAILAVDEECREKKVVALH